MAELGVGYISIVPEVSKISPGIAKALKGAEGAADSSGQSMGGKISSALGGALKKGAVGAGVATGGILATSITKGLGRLNSIEQAESKLKGLGNSTQQVGSIMENALASVNGTAFGLEEAATTAGSLVAAGIKPGQELEGVLTTVADSATIAGRSMSDMGLIFGSVAAKGKLQGDDMLQLLAGGIPVLQLLAEETGKTSEEISDMVSNGEVNFALFERAMKRGMGGAALEAGNTVEGAFKNMGAALGRFGATLAGPFFTQAAGAFGGVTEWVDKLNTSMKPVMENVGTWLEGTAIPALKDFGQQGAEGLRNVWKAFKDSGAIEVTVDAFKQLWSAGKALAPALASIGKSVGTATAALGVSSWTAFVAVLKAAGSVAEALAGPLQTVAEFMEDHPSLVVAAVAAWAGFKTIPGIVGKVTAVTDTLKSSLSGMVAKTAGAQSTVKAITGDFRTLSPEIGRSGAAMKALGNNVPTIRNMQAAFVNAESGAKGFASSMRVGVTGAATSVGGAMKGIGTNIMNAFGGPAGLAIAGATALFLSQKSAAAANEAAHEKMTQAVYEGKKAQTELASALAGTTGELGEQGLAAAAKVAGGALADFVEKGTHSNSIVENINQSTVAIDELLNKIPGLGTEQSRANVEITKANAAAQDSYKQLEKSMDDLGIPMENLNSVIAQGGDEYGNLISKLRESGNAGNDAADQLEQARGKVEDLVNASRNMEPAMAQAAEGVEVLADASSSADDKLSALEQTMQALGLAPKDAQQAMMDAADAVDEIAQSATEAADASGGLGDQLFNMDGQLEPTSANARELADTLNGMRGELQNVAVNGGDTQKTFEQMGPVLDSLQQKYGLNEDQMRSLREEYGLVPDKIDTLVDLEGADEATQKLVAISAAIGEVPPGKDVNVGIVDGEAKKKLEDFGIKVTELDDGSSTINLEDQAAVDKYNWWVSEGFPSIDMSNPTAKANLDNSGLLYNKDYAMMQLATLDLERPMPWASMDISSLSSQQLSALQKVGLLDGQTPTPDAFMNISQLSKEQQEALAKVFNLDAQTPTPAADLNKSQLDANKSQADGQIRNLDGQRANPKADLNTDGVRDGASESKSWIAGIIGKTVTITFRAVYEGFKDALGLGNNSTGGYFAGPAYASGGRHGGYRLPTSGPGTEVTDGFIAFDKNNVPAARLDAGEWIINSRSSKKYHKELREINNGTYQKLPGYASGGVAHADDIDKFARGIEGKPYVWGGVNWGDCSGAMSAIARFAVGLAPFGGRFATGNQGDALRSMGFTMGRGSSGDLRFGWYNGGAAGGHTSGTLPNGVNVEMGGGRGNGQYGGPAAGAWHSQYTDHAFLRVPTSYRVSGVDGADGYGSPGDRTYGTPDSDSYDESVPSMERYNSSSSASTGAESDAPTSWSDVAGRAGEAFAKGQAQNALSVFGIPDTPPILAARKQWEEERRKAAEQAKQDSEQSRSGINNQVSNVSESGQTSASQAPPNLDVPENINRNIDIAYNPNGGAEQWRTTVEMALKRVGMALSNTNRTIEQIDIESGGDPNAQNNWDINAQNGNPSIGLLQVIKTTFQAHRDKELPDDQRHPLANVVAALNYTQSRYGGPSNIWPTRAGYRDGGEVRGPGGRRADRIPAWLSATEHVINASSAVANRDLLSAINAGFDAEQVMSDLIGANEELRVAADGGDWGYGSLSSLLGDQRGRAAANLAGDLGETSRQVRDEVVVNNNFTAASPDAMYRMYRREASRSHGGRIGAR